MKRPLILNIIILFCLYVCLAAGCGRDITTINSETTGIQTATTTKVSESNVTETTTTNNSTTTSSTETTISDLRYQLIVIGDQLVLIPAMLEDYSYALSENEVNLVWRYDEIEKNWVVIKWSIMKSNSVTGKFITDEQSSTFDIYRFVIGDFIGYHLRNAEAAHDNMEQRLFEDLITGKPVFQQRSKNYTILQIFEDLYAIDDTGNLKMISKRKIDSYDFDTIQKKGQGDLFRWYWTSQPVCCPQNNSIYYLSAREGQFYSIWQIDLEQNTEKRFGKDVAIELLGLSENQLITIMNPDKSEFYSKLISVTDPNIFTPLAEQSWKAYSGHLYNCEGNSLILEYLERQIKIESSIVYQPMLFDDHIAWFSAQREVNEIRLLRLDLNKKTVSSISTVRMNTLSGWQDVFANITTSEMTISQAAEQGTRVTID